MRHVTIAVRDLDRSTTWDRDDLQRGVRHFGLMVLA
jgi:hypothetical protein